jgi:putative aldouronate transport system permease protein
MVSRAGDIKQRILRHWQLYLVFLLPLAYIIIFRYLPMYGAQIAFKDFAAIKGVWGSPWVGLKHFANFIKSPYFGRLIGNTLGISTYYLIVGFPIPIILALSLNEVRSKSFKKAVQMVTYAPYFISTVVLVSLVMQVLSPQFGIVNNLIKALGGRPINFMGSPKLIKSIYVWSGVWQYTGYSSIIYIAALAGIDPALHEAAIVDGASKLQRIIHVDIPGIMPTVTILLILQVGQLMSVGFEKIFLMQNPLNMSTADVISTYVYRIGLTGGQFSFSTAVGLFNSTVNLVLLLVVNRIARKIGDTSLW